jgi:hypothetical protein
MRDAWGQLVIVEGLVKRDPMSGRPVACIWCRRSSPAPRDSRVDGEGT